MTETYHKLANTVEIKNANDLTISRAMALHAAIQRAHDYTLIQILRCAVESCPVFECLIVEVECDGVPPKNAAGILYRERLALCVPADTKKLVDVLALRKGFPVLIHQNQVAPDKPATICLYSESPVAIARTWTPQSFLRRIQWWLESSSREELHLSDQPVEHLFFASKYELVLPYDLDKLRRNPRQPFVVVRGYERPDKGFTCFLMQADQDSPKDMMVKHVGLTLPPIVHGQVEHDPTTLGQLNDLLEGRGVDIIDSLRTALQGGIDEQGVSVSDNDAGTVILLHIPIKRTADAEPEKVAYRAFWVSVGSLELGVACGALFKQGNRYYRDILGGPLNGQPTTAWRDQAIAPMDVLIQNDGATARRQSGIAEAGPAGVLIGAGALGSALLNLWGRSGWGDWSVIDNDHIKPHNLSRHVAYFQHVGQTKAMVVANLHGEAMYGATSVVPIVADACDLERESVSQAINGATLVVDASTTLEYPRAASGLNSFPRHVSVFVTPDGNGAVLLAEDTKRSYRLRTLEAQYYRALIERDFGKNHLSGHVSTFWSGASCRDISHVMPYSRILGHAGTLAEQIQVATNKEDALIRVWQRNPVSGAVEVHDVLAMAEQRFELDGLDLYIDDGVFERLRHLRQQSLPNETGGVVLGYYDFNIKAIMVVIGLPAPLDSKVNSAFFERGIAGLQEAVEDANKRTSGEVRYIGEWHSHPPGCSASPSRADLVQIAYLSCHMADEGLPVVQIIVGERDIQILQGLA